MDRRDFVGLALLATTPVSFATAAANVLDAGVREQQARMASGALSAETLTRAYLARIASIDRAGPRLNAIIELNPDAIRMARMLDRERSGGKLRGPLHGCCVLLKDNIATGDSMRTSAGSLALADVRATRDAGVAARLREAGAVILGKTNLSEWANMRGVRSSSGWSARGGLTRNPYALNRSCSGSSSGSAAATAAALATFAVGTETDGSIVSPASACGVVGIKPTVGLVSRAGIIPISHSQDTAGPMGRSVADAALLLAALAGADPRDASTSAAKVDDYAAALTTDGMRGKRLGVARNYFGRNPKTDALIERALVLLKTQGAELIDVQLPNTDKYNAAEYQVLLYEFKPGLAAWFADYAPHAPVRDMASLIAFNLRERGARAGMVRPGTSGAGAGQRRPDDAGVPGGARHMSALRARRRYRSGAARAPARCAGGAHVRAGVAGRSGQR